MDRGIAELEERDTGRAVKPRPALALPERDVRAKRPPLLSFLLRMETLRRVARIVSLLLVDLVALFLALFTALALKAAFRVGFDWDMVYGQTKDYLPFAYLVTVLLFARSSLYANRAERPGFARIFSSLFQVTVVALIFAVVSGQEFSSYYLFYGALFFALIYVGGLRHVYERVTGVLLRAAGYRRRTVLVGSDKHLEHVAHALTDGSERIELVGYMSLRPRPDNGLKSLGPIERLPAVLDAHRIDEVIIADPDFPQERTVELVDQCHARGVKLRVAPSTMEILMQRAEFIPGGTVPLFELRPLVFEGIDFAVKRAFDLIGATLLCLLLSPVLLASAAAVRFSSRGPVFYRSVRPGIGGTPFACLKFRTMKTGADEAQDELEELNEADGALFKIRNDPRLTRVGRVLRRFSLDELPQLVNVLRGEMSLVGPRPLPQRDFEHLEDWHKKRYHVLPGITGIWQVSGRSELDFDEMVRLDFFYIERWSPFLDLTIILKTLPAVLRGRGAF